MSDFRTCFWGFLALESAIFLGGYVCEKMGYKQASEIAYTTFLVSTLIGVGLMQVKESDAERAYYKSIRDEYGQLVFPHRMSDGTIIYRDRPYH